MSKYLCRHCAAFVGFGHTCEVRTRNLESQNKKLTEALGKTRKELAVALNFLRSMKWQYYDVEEPEFQCQYSLSETLFNLHKFNLSETPKEEV